MYKQSERTGFQKYFNLNLMKLKICSKAVFRYETFISNYNLLPRNDLFGGSADGWSQKHDEKGGLVTALLLH